MASGKTAGQRPAKVSGGAYPERLPVAVPQGFRARVERAARREMRSVPDWCRDALRRALESSERAARRKRGGK